MENFGISMLLKQQKTYFTGYPELEWVILSDIKLPTLQL